MAMSMEDPGDRLTNPMENLLVGTKNFTPQFKAIGQSLKKRFFRKPNYEECAEQYEDLAQELEREENLDFAAKCCIEASKCHETLKDHTCQVNLLVKAARLFLAVLDEQKNFDVIREEDKGIIYSGPFGGHLKGIRGNFPQAILCLEQAANLYKKEGLYGHALVIFMEVGEELYKENWFGEALKYFKMAHSLAKVQFSYPDQLYVLEYVLKCKIKTTEYENALETVSETLQVLKEPSKKATIPKEFYKEIYNRLEIIRVLLILILGNNSEDLLNFIWPDPPSPPADQELDENGLINHDQERLFLELKSLVFAVQYGSIDEITDVKYNIYPHLTNCHFELFETLIQMQMC